MNRRMAGALLVALIVLLSGCAGKQGLMRHDGENLKAEKYGSYTALEVEAIAGKVLEGSSRGESVKTPCPPNATVNNQRKGYLHLGRNPVDPEQGYLLGSETVVRLSRDTSLRVEEHGGKWTTGMVPNGTVMVADSSGKLLRICSCGNGVALPDGRPAYVSLPQPVSTLTVKTLLPAEVTSKEATLRGSVSSDSGEEVLAWFAYKEEDDGGKWFATEPQYVRSEFVEFRLVGLEANSRYHYQFVAVNAIGKREGDVIWFLTDKDCLGSGTIASGAGGFFLTFGLVNIANPVGWGSMVLGTGLSAYSIIDKDSDPTCKAVAGLLGGTTGAVGGISYHNAHKSGTVPPSDPKPGPSPPNGPAPMPDN